MFLMFQMAVFYRSLTRVRNVINETFFFLQLCFVTFVSRARQKISIFIPRLSMFLYSLFLLLLSIVLRKTRV